MHTQNYSPPLSIVDVHQTRQLGPVSPPVIGEDVSKHGLCCVEQPSSKEDASSEEKGSSQSDIKCKLSSSHCNQHNLRVSESPSPPLSIIPHSEQYKNSVSESLTMSEVTDYDDVSYQSGQKDTPNFDSSLSTAIIQDHAHLQSSNLQLHEELKPELSSASTVESDADSSSSHSKQCDIPKSQASLPTFSIENDAEIFEGDQKSPSLLCLDTCGLESTEENSDSSDTVITKPTNINFDRNKLNGKHNSDISMHSAATRNEFISKFVVTKMEVESDTCSRIDDSNETDGKVKPRVRKFVRKVGSQFNKRKHASVKSIPPDVITLE
jgi:hypothetical protein